MVCADDAYNDVYDYVYDDSSTGIRKVRFRLWVNLRGVAGVRTKVVNNNIHLDNWVDYRVSRTNLWAGVNLRDVRGPNVFYAGTLCTLSPGPSLLQPHPGDGWSFCCSPKCNLLYHGATAGGQRKVSWDQGIRKWFYIFNSKFFLEHKYLRFKNLGIPLFSVLTLTLIPLILIILWLNFLFFAQFS